MRAEVVSIGSKRLLSQVVHANTAFNARYLAAVGLDLPRAEVALRDSPGERAAARAPGSRTS